MGLHDAPAYGLWPVVVINSLVFLIFAFSFTKPSSARDWRVLYEAQRVGRLAKTGPYAHMRHPQYAGFVPRWQARAAVT